MTINNVNYFYQNFGWDKMSNIAPNTESLLPYLSISDIIVIRELVSRGMNNTIERIKVAFRLSDSDINLLCSTNQQSYKDWFNIHEQDQ